jgi:hypothetical protein
MGVEQHKLGIFKNRELRKILLPKEDEVRLDRTKVHKEELQNLCSSPGTVWVAVGNREGDSSRAADKSGGQHKY